MKRLTKTLFFLLLPLSFAVSTQAFSLLGVFKNGATPNDWQAAGFGNRPAGLGYSLTGDIGGPMFPLEAYRWNLPVITYGFDESFRRYFGPAGEAAVSNAFQILNDLPPFTTMSRDLSEFPWDSKQAISFNQQFGTLGLLDMKSQTLAAVLEQLGLAKPERFVWGLRSRTTPAPGLTNYSVVMMNYDPVTLLQSRYVNGVLYHYQIFDALGPMGGEWASAVEFYQADPFYLAYSAVAGGLGSSDFEQLDTEGNVSSVVSGLGSGEYYVGLTRDDIGGLRYLYGTNNLVTEQLVTNAPNTITGSQLGIFGSPWDVYLNNTNVFLTSTNTLFATNSLGTNLIVQGIRPGINKLKFKRVDFDSGLGRILIPSTNKFTDTVITNGRPVVQALERASLQPDFLFLVQDLGLAQGLPVTFRRSGTANWQNNDLINGFSNLGGPGVIPGQAQISFSDVLPFFINSDPGFLDEQAGSGSFIWSSFDGTTNPPAIFPAYLSITLRDLENQVLGGGR